MHVDPINPLYHYLYGNGYHYFKNPHTGVVEHLIDRYVVQVQYTCTIQTSALLNTLRIKYQCCKEYSARTVPYVLSKKFPAEPG